MATAQYCPTPVRGNSFNNRVASPYNSFGTASLNYLTYDFATTIDRGFRTGELTRHEVFILENDLNRLARRIRAAYLDGRVTRSELSFIEWDARNLSRHLEREWNDKDRRDLG